VSANPAFGPLLGYLLRVALGERLLVTLLAALGASAALAAFLGSTALVEQREFAAVLAANAARLAVVLALILFTCFHVRRAFEAGAVDLLLSRPVSRRDFVLAHILLVILAAALTAALAGLAVGAIARPGLAAAGWWTLSLFVEGTIMAVAALFFALALPGAATSALACLGLYALGRMIGLLGSIAAAYDPAGPIMWTLGRLVGLLALVLPRLDLLSRSVWLVHGVGDPAELGPVLLQSGLYVILLGAAASFDFGRRQL
jgi:ABC-type transport system involved in multi-copper enzyme maturation permease subunit